LKAAQTSLGIPADGKWGPQTEDAIQKQLAAACVGNACSAADEDGTANVASVAGAPRAVAVGLAVVAAALTMVAVGVVVWRARA
jgi:peptidoglycan hydrolase-like protein with peptidoglycan-binding domain